jgi:hypothetical protein
MFSKFAFTELKRELDESGYKGSLAELKSILGRAKNKTQMKNFHSNLRDSMVNKKYINEENICHIESLVKKLCVKYSECYVMGNSELHFQSKKHSRTGETFVVSMYLDDSTNQGLAGFYGGKHLRVLYGYGDHRAESCICLIEKEPV